MHKHDAIIELYPNVKKIYGDIAYDIDDNEVSYDETAVNNLVLSREYKEQRKFEYPSIGEQLDMQYWDAVNGTTTWKDAIAQVKADNPKPE